MHHACLPPRITMILPTRMTLQKACDSGSFGWSCWQMNGQPCSSLIGNRCGSERLGRPMAFLLAKAPSCAGPEPPTASQTAVNSFNSIGGSKLGSRDSERVACSSIYFSISERRWVSLICLSYSSSREATAFNSETTFDIIIAIHLLDSFNRRRRGFWFFFGMSCQPRVRRINVTCQWGDILGIEWMHSLLLLFLPCWFSIPLIPSSMGGRGNGEIRLVLWCLYLFWDLV